jgi:DNA-binding transcriptional LysR family regulator
MVDRNDLQAFMAVAQCDGFRPGATLLKLSASSVSGAVKRLEAALDVKLFAGVGKGKKLSDAGVALWQVLRSWGSSESALDRAAAMAAPDLADLVERSSPGAAVPRHGGAEPAAARPPEAKARAAAPQAAPPAENGGRLRIALPQHPALAHQVRAAILAGSRSAAAVELVPGGPWTDVLGDLFDRKIDLGFCWSAGRAATGYAPFVRARRLRPDKFDHLVMYRTYAQKFGPRRLSGSKLIKTPIAIPAVAGQPAMGAALAAGLLRYGLTIHPVVGELPDRGGILTSALATIPQEGHVLVPLGWIHVEGGIDAVFRSDMDMAQVHSVLEILRGAFAVDAARSRKRAS